MQNSSAFQFLAIDTIHESTTNPRRTFEESKLHGLAGSIRQHGLIQPITVRPNASRFEIVAGARRYRAAQLAEFFSVPARIVEIDDAQAQEWQIIENSLRIDVHPYEEATGYQRLLDLPGYDVATIAERTGKSASHIYARLSLLQLIPAIAEAFTQERITASHANLLARLPQEAQAKAYEQCWRKDWQDKEPHLLPARFLTSWIQANLYLSLADAPFDREDPTLNPAAGACAYNTALFADVISDKCMDGTCFGVKVTAFVDREIAANPELVQIENGYRSPKEKRPGAVQRGHFREIDPATDNPDAEPVPPCASAKPAIIVFGRNVGATLTVCTDEDCPVHDPNAEKKRQAAEERVQAEAETVSPEPIEPTEEEKQNQEERRRERERQDEERRLADEQRQQEYEAERNRRAELQKARNATFERIVGNAPAPLSAAQMRIFLRALVNLDPYTFAQDVAEHFAGRDEDNDRTPEAILLDIIDGVPDHQLTRLALRLALTGHTGIPRESGIDFLAEADAAFAPQTQPKAVPARKEKKPKPIKPRSRSSPQRTRRKPLRGKAGVSPPAPASFATRRGQFPSPAPLPFL